MQSDARLSFLAWARPSIVGKEETVLLGKRGYVSFHLIPTWAGVSWMIANECLSGKNLLIIVWYNAHFDLLLRTLVPSFLPSSRSIVFRHRYPVIFIHTHTTSWPDGELRDLRHTVWEKVLCTIFFVAFISLFYVNTLNRVNFFSR